MSRRDTGLPDAEELKTEALRVIAIIRITEAHGLSRPRWPALSR